MIDLHCHVLPGLDDGPPTMEEAVALARDQAALGVTTVVATPHISYGWPDVTAGRIAEGVETVNARLREEGIGLTVVPGAEVALTRAVDLSDDELAALRLGAGPWLLLEPPYSAGAATVEPAMMSLLHRGHRLVIAHPERCPAFLADRASLLRLVAAGALCSVTASALTGRFGRDARRFATGLIAEGAAHDVASDAHGGNPRRPPGMADHVVTAGLGDRLDWLCADLPRAVIEGTELPPRPTGASVPRSGGLARLLRRS